jgi:hypothetical protein
MTRIPSGSTLSGNRYLAVTDNCPIVSASRNRMASSPGSGTSRTRPYHGRRQLNLRQSSPSNAGIYRLCRFCIASEIDWRTGSLPRKAAFRACSVAASLTLMRRSPDTRYLRPKKPSVVGHAFRAMPSSRSKAAFLPLPSAACSASG